MTVTSAALNALTAIIVLIVMLAILEVLARKNIYPVQRLADIVSPRPSLAPAVIPLPTSMPVDPAA